MGEGSFEFPMPPLLVAIGDLQGNLAGLEDILRATGLVDRTGRWAAGDAHLVQLGDIFGRASDPKGVCDRLRALAEDASNAGGRVHVLVGNHEAEVVHRYEFECDPREYLRFATLSSYRRWKRERAAAERSFWSLGEEESLPLANLIGAWELLHPLGREEFRKALAPNGEYGSWLISLPAAVKIGDIVLSHAGILPKYAKRGLAWLNAKVREAMAMPEYFPALPAGNILIDPDGPLWTRAFAWGTKATLLQVREAGAMLGAATQVVAHTPTSDLRIQARWGRHVICIDTGIGRSKGGRLSALIVQDGVFWAVYPPKGRVRIGPVPEPLR